MVEIYSLSRFVTRRYLVVYVIRYTIIMMMMNEVIQRPQRIYQSYLSVPLSKKRLKIYTQLKKAESALTTQIRTGKIGLADFLYKRRVPSVTSPACSCGWHRQTSEHVIMFCRLIGNREQMFRAAGTSDYQQLTESSKL